MDAVRKGCHVCRMFRAQLTEEQQQILLNFEKTNSQHGTIQLIYHRFRPPQFRLQFGVPPELQSLSEGKLFSNLTLVRTEGMILSQYTMDAN
jgi:hypothetical protein